MTASLFDWLQLQTATPESRYLVSITAVLLGMLFTVAVRRLDPYLEQRFRPTSTEILESVAVGLIWIGVVWTIVVTWRATPEVRRALTVLDIGQKQLVLAGVSITVIAAAYFLTRLTRRWVRALTEQRTEISSHEREIAHHVVQVAVYITAGIVVLSLWNVPIGNLLLGAGFLGIVLGLAARQTLGAMLAGFVVLFSRPFEIGDWVQVGENEGVVTEITVVNTRLQTFDGEYVILPNDKITAEEIVNRSRKGRLRIEVEVGVDYGSDLQRAMSLARDAMRDLDPVLTVPEPHVICKRFDDSAVVLGLRFWIDNPSARRRWRAQTAVVRATKEAFASEDIKIPFPQRELSGRAETGGFRVADDGEPAIFDADTGEDKERDEA